jgi:hypothetical protein
VKQGGGMLVATWGKGVSLVLHVRIWMLENEGEKEGTSIKHRNVYADSLIRAAGL